ncbi:NADH:flavin oxidoreductase [Agrobacterium rubi]|uniref:oxidoreductase n=1 Tax=Agrobacterium rubi TaxID=28099 RepID=UPI0015720B2F|nr:NADH:flavin oxidoreductase [Agrobacterium rubi]NTF10587.1 NADH:flavin oxidoreductase [Agrobacterium rubi]NTF22981.1 NADH:flavin oxidoreductase [Agrobacterium rubi]NTF29912.1 NADH:flavin oxidoreductase [Agrobacterium rubi]
MSEKGVSAFSRLELAGSVLKNRLVMAPLTRQMADDDGTPNDEMVAYYARRARGGIGMIITEGTFFNDELGCVAYLRQPGIATTRNVAGWRKVVEAVHRHHAPILLQLMHGGRVSDPRCLHVGESPVSASDSQSPGWVLYTDNDLEKHNRGIEAEWPKVTFPPARALTEVEIERIADGFAQGARRAIEAGFDGVEVHGANGYLLYQFIHPNTNHRTDIYGGSPENNVRFAKLVCKRVREAIGHDKIITLRLSQDGVDDFLGAWPGGVAYARAVGEALRDVDADAIHWASFDWKANRASDHVTPMPVALRESSGKPMIVNGGIADKSDCDQAIDAGAGDLIAVGRPLFAQPDWPHIIRSGEPYEWATFDRKYVIKPPYDYEHAYPHGLPADKWDPDLSKRRRAGWQA